MLDAEQEAPHDACELHCRLPDGRGIGVRFVTPPTDRDPKQRRLEMLASTFDAVVDQDTSQRRKSRPPVETSLRDELLALCERAAAVNAIVIDANSPVEWGAARPQEAIPLSARTSGPSAASTASDEHAKPDLGVAVVSRRALHVVRGLPEIAALRKGKHIRYLERDGEVPLIAHSFAGIYLLVMVFDGPFDELRGERAILDALPRVERLVLALPPLDPPPPHAGVMSLRRPRRR